MKLSHVAVLAALCALPSTAFALSVSNATQLAAALRTARGGEVFDLAPGNYGALYLSSRRFSVPVTFRSVDPSRPAVFGQTQISNVSGIRFDSVEFASPLAAGQPSWTAAVRLNAATGITFNNVSVHGSLDGNPANDGYGIFARSSSNITVSNSRFSQLGSAAVFSGNQNINLTGNTVRDVRSEGFNFAAVQGVRIVGNSFSNFRPLAGDHPDAIQFWTAGTTVASSNIVISGNLVAGSASGHMQGIFMGGGAGVLRYQNVSITNNTLVGTMWNGIAVGGADGLSITGNNVVTIPDAVFRTAWITVTDARGVINGNRVKQILINNSPGIVVGNNILTPVSAALGDIAVRDWYAAHSLPLPNPTPPGSTPPPTKNATANISATTAAFSVTTPTPDSQLPVADDLFQSDPLKTAAIPGTSNTVFDDAGSFQKALAQNGDPVQGDLLSAVPEPATWLQLLFGFGAVGWAIRRSKGQRRIPTA